MDGNSNNANLAPEGWHTVTPRIVVIDSRGLVEFLKAVFAAAGEYQADRPSEIRIGDSIIMISETDARSSMPAFLYVYVEKCDEVYDLALAAGANYIEKPFDTPYGDRRCMVEDRWGNIWQIATRSSN